jgi:Ca2+-binding EF-hand superfamily protein
MSMKKPLCVVLASASLLAVAVPAFAGDDDAMKAKVSKRVDAVFAKLDADKDGRISRDEASKGPKMAKMFDRVDADHDGFVSRAEMSAAVQRRMERAQAKQQQQQQTPTSPGPQAPAPTK